jgi:DNA-binding SARP family transcriptional activator
VAAVALEISLLGPPRVRRDGEPVSFDTRKATALLAHLALAERARSREALCELLWPEHEPERARGALRRTLSTLRKGIGEQRVDTSGDSVALLPGDGVIVDVHRFRELAGKGSLAAAAEVYEGELLEGFALRDSPEFEHWQSVEADALRRELGTVLAQLVAELSARGEFERALPLARRWLELDPLHEPAHRELILLYAYTGDRAAALSQYRDCVRTLSQELGVPPVDETAALFERISEGALTPAPAETVPEAPGEPAQPPSELPLVGRAGDLQAVTAAHSAAAPDGRLAVIEGEAGIGKTRLAAELVARARERGGVVLSARCHDDEAGLPYGPVVELLRQALDRDGWGAAVTPRRLADASLLLPELAGMRDDLPPPLSLAEPGARARLLDGVGAVLAAACAGEAPGLVLIDDVHGADEATLDVLAYLGRRLRGRSLLLVVTWRSEGVPPGHRLRRLTVDLARDGTATIVRLARLGEDEVATLVRAARPGGDAALEHRVYLESEGLPLFVAEYLAALETGEAAGGTMPVEVRDLLQARLGGIGPVARQVLGAAAVIGRSFDLETVRAASGRGDEEAVGALEELTAQGLVRELPGTEPAYDFSHQKLRELVYEEISLARRRLLHRRAAGTLARVEDAALVAQHLRLAGDAAEAAEHYVRAAEHAASLLAHADALDHLDAALALGHPDAAALHERVGDLRTLTGDYRGALASYETAAALCEPGSLAPIEHKLGEVHERRGERDRAETRLLAALDAAPAEDLALRARIHADLSLTVHRAGRAQEAPALAEQARMLAEAADDRRALAQAHNMLGVLAWDAGALDTARSELERSLALAEELADAPARAAALNNLALVSRDAGEPEAALELTETALALCEAYGDRHREAALHNNLADLHHVAGRPEESMAHLKRAVAIFSEVGADEATRLPEVWKLVSW